MKVLVAGGRGMVGEALTRLCTELGDQVFSYNHAELDIADAANVNEVVVRDRPDVVVNCAAWTDVDGCESDHSRAYAANAAGPAALARASRHVGAVFVTISTDYVFDGEKQGFYTQRDDPNPQSVYACSKLEGERQSQLEYARTIVVRTGFVFGPGGRNFLSTVIDRLKRGETLKAINDSAGTPTYAPDLAQRLRELAMKDLPGIYHIVNSGEGANYQEFAQAAADAAGISTTVGGVSMYSLNRPAARPKNSRMKCLLSEAIGLNPMPDWRDALRQFAGASETEFSTSQQ